MSKADRVRALFRTAADFGASESERQTADRFAWDLLRKDETLIEEIAQAILTEASEQEREPEWPSPVFFSVWAATQQAKAAKAAEARAAAAAAAAASAKAAAAAAAARRERLEDEAAMAAAAAAARRQRPREPGRARGPRVGGTHPAPGVPFPPVPPENDRWERIKNVASEWLGDTLQQVAEGFTLVERINEEVVVGASNTRKTVTVKVTFPVELAREVFEETGSLEEFSRLIGVKVGEDLALAFKQADWGED